jgi:hypothetical protein
MFKLTRLCTRGLETDVRLKHVEQWLTCRCSHGTISHKHYLHLPYSQPQSVLLFVQRPSVLHFSPCRPSLVSTAPTGLSLRSIYIIVYVCMYVCMFRHNYLSVNVIVSFPSFTGLYKYREEYKQGEMWHSAQRAEISQKICMFQPGCCLATGTWLISAETNNKELLIARQPFRNHGYIDGNNWSRRL